MLMKSATTFCPVRRRKSRPLRPTATARTGFSSSRMNDAPLGFRTAGGGPPRAPAGARRPPHLQRRGDLGRALDAADATPYLTESSHLGAPPDSDLSAGINRVRSP